MALLWTIKAIVIVVLLYICTSLFISIRRQRNLEYAKKRVKFLKEIQTRTEIINQLKSNTFDILVIGGGITGSGCALDAASRGIKVAMIEKYDFASETSSKSTKLLHGGFRYLFKAISHFSVSHLMIVICSLCERKKIMNMAPYLTYTVKIIIPIHSYLKIPGYYILALLYDWLSFGNSLGRSYIISDNHLDIYSSNLPKNKICASVAYYDGMMQDARINVLVAKTASKFGAVIGNYIEFIDFIKNKHDKITSVSCVDRISGSTFEIKAKLIISATGCFTDNLKCKNTLNGVKKVICGSSGTHIVLDPICGLEKVGLYNPDTVDERVSFILPWNGYTLVGSTDKKSETVENICPTREEVEFLIAETQKYSKHKISLQNITSAWAGIRPLLSDDDINKRADTEAVVRDYAIFDDDNGLISVAGGKWTLFRVMAEDVINIAVKKYGIISMNNCVTKDIKIVGAQNYSRNLYFYIARVLNVTLEYAKLLSERYGTEAFKLRKYLKDWPNMISAKYSFTEAEVIYCFKHEYACTSMDIVMNRFEVAFYDAKEAYEMNKKVNVLLQRYCASNNIKYFVDEERTKKLFRSVGLELLSDIKL